VSDAGDCMSRSYPATREQLDDMKRKASAPGMFRLYTSKASADSGTQKNAAEAITELFVKEISTGRTAVNFGHVPEVSRAIDWLIMDLRLRMPEKLAETLCRAASSTPDETERQTAQRMVAKYLDDSLRGSASIAESSRSLVSAIADALQKSRLRAAASSNTAMPAPKRGVTEIHLRTVREVLDRLLPGDDEDSVFEKEAAEDHIRELLAAEPPKGEISTPVSADEFATSETTKPEMGVCGICETPHTRFDFCFGWRRTSGKTAKTPSTPKA
jgi:hypothetical protein